MPKASLVVHTWVVDRVDQVAGRCRLIRDRDGVAQDLALTPSPFGALVPSEGLVLQVPLDPRSHVPRWAHATADVDATARRVRDAIARLERLGAADPGDDRSL